MVSRRRAKTHSSHRSGRLPAAPPSPEATILEELRAVVGRIPKATSDAFIDRLLAADQIFVVGRGRTGLIAGAFAMRLMHLGLRVFIVGDISTPKICQRDLLIACSGAGTSRTVQQMMGIARHENAAIVAISYASDSAIAKGADVYIRVPTSNLRARGGSRRTVQPLGSLFEQALLIYFDGLVLQLMERLRVSPDDMAQRHTNLE
jgi:6-phospho-3-hexuloisomerase